MRFAVMGPGLMSKRVKEARKRQSFPRGLAADLSQYNVKHLTGLAGRPFSQGSVERWNGTLKAILGRLMSARGNKRWLADLDEVVLRYNENVHSEAGVPPRRREPAEYRADGFPEQEE
jgi:transposase InsO family protein